MKAVLVALVVLSRVAAAESFSLDYKANDPSCVDASRFADEVSAKLGFMPWDKSSAAIRVRIEKDGAQFTGTFRNVDGNAKVLAGATCQDVTASLVVTVAAAVDRNPAREAKQSAPQPEAAPPSIAAGLIPVIFRTTDGGRVDITRNTSNGMGQASNGTTVYASYYDSVCTSPCTAGLPSGRNYLRFIDPDSQSVLGDGYVIDKPTQITLTHKSRHGTRMEALVTGIVLTGLGAAAFALAGDSALGIVGGSLGIAVGIPVMMLPLWIPDTFIATQSP
jgi:hypothetical protein